MFVLSSLPADTVTAAGEIAAFVNVIFSRGGGGGGVGEPVVACRTSCGCCGCCSLMRKTTATYKEHTYMKAGRSEELLSSDKASTG